MGSSICSAILLRFEDEALHVAPAQVHHDGRATLTELARDGGDLFDHLEVGDLAEREQPAVVHAHGQRLRSSIFSRFLLQAHHDVETTIASTVCRLLRPNAVLATRFNSAA
jgi:hypothetical protein